MTRHSIDLSLAPHPLHAVYWSIVAPLFYQLVILVFASELSPGVEAVLKNETDNAASMQWIMLVLIHFLVLYRLCRWAQLKTGTPFAGSLDVTPNWLTTALLLGPAILIGGSVFVGTVFGGGDPNWAYASEEPSTLFSRENLGLMMIVFVVILAPWVEEIGFRGVALGCLLGRGMDPRMAVFIVAIGFTAVHAQYSPLGMLPVFASGLFLGWLRIRSGTIAAPIAAHMAANGMVVWLLSATPVAS